MSLNLPYGIKPLNALSNIDTRYGPWTTCAEALSETTGVRCVGLTVGIIESSAVVEYWFKTGTTNTDLVEKTMGGSGSGTLTGATSGLHLINSGTSVALGGLLTGDTTIDASGNSFNLTNIGDFQVSSGLSTTFGINNEGLSFLFSGGSITYLTNQGILYGGKYHTEYVDRSLVDKEYVDLVATGLDPKSAVVVATTTGDGNIDLTGGTFVSGTTIDSIVVEDGWRVLVKNQTNAVQNGIYNYSASTSGFTRSSDFDGSPVGEVSQGAFIPVITGDTLYNTLWILITPDPIIVDTTPLNFTYFSRPTSLIAGHGIDISGNTIAVDGASLVGNSLKWTGTTKTFNVDVTGGTLGTALNSKLNVTTFSGYTGTTQPILNAALTGVTYAGSGTTLYSGTTGLSGRTIVFNTIIGSGLTTVQKVGNEIIVFSSGATGGGIYTGAPITAIEVGGIPATTNISGCTFTELWEALLIPELFQTSVDTPSTSVGATFSGIQEIGYSASQTITPTYIPGAITPLYETSGGTTRGGAANNYAYTGPSVAGGFNSCTSCVINPYVVTGGSQSWSVCTRYDEGACVKGSKGTVNPAYPTVCPQDSCATSTPISVCGILPWYWGTNASGTITGPIVAAGNKVKLVVTQSTPITFNASTEFMWFAAPNGTTPKTKWWVAQGNESTIGTPGSIWAASCPVTVTSGEGCWTGCSYDVYVTCAIGSTAVGVPMCLYY